MFDGLKTWLAFKYAGLTYPVIKRVEQGSVTFRIIAYFWNKYAEPWLTVR